MHYYFQFESCPFFIDLILLANLLWRVIHNFLSSFSLNNTDSKLVNAYSGTNCTIKYPINAHPVFKFSTMWHYYTLLFVIILILPHTHTQMRMLNEAVFCTIKTTTILKSPLAFRMSQGIP